MKKVVSTLAAIAVIATASASFATIVASKHDLSSTNSTYTGSNTNQICAFCHTPHNAVQNIPLWNRSNPNGSGFALYSSPTMKNHYGSVGFTADSVSLFCMSCHDGGSLAGRIANTPSDFVAGDTIANATDPTAVTGGKIVGDAKLGTNLMNSHPVNFAVTVYGASNGLGDVSASKIKTATVTNGLPLFKSARGANTLECASCHAVHEPGSDKKFLRTTNSGSKLCLACHVK